MMLLRLKGFCLVCALCRLLEYPNMHVMCTATQHSHSNLFSCCNAHNMQVDDAIAMCLEKLLFQKIFVRFCLRTRLLANKYQQSTNSGCLFLTPIYTTNGERHCNCFLPIQSKIKREIRNFSSPAATNEELIFISSAQSKACTNIGIIFTIPYIHIWFARLSLGMHPVKYRT